MFDGEHVSPASLPGMYDRTISLFTFSKSYAMTGLRLGWLAGPPKAIAAAIKVHQFVNTAASTCWT